MQSILQSAAAWFGRWSAGLLQGSSMGSINLLLTFYFLFYLLRDEERAVAALKDALPLSREEFALLSSAWSPRSAPAFSGPPSSPCCRVCSAG